MASEVEKLKRYDLDGVDCMDTFDKGPWLDRNEAIAANARDIAAAVKAAEKPLKERVAALEIGVVEMVRVAVDDLNRGTKLAELRGKVAAFEEMRYEINGTIRELSNDQDFTDWRDICKIVQDVAKAKRDEAQAALAALEQATGRGAL